jgi:hypothetical protein
VRDSSGSRDARAAGGCVARRLKNAEIETGPQQ